MYQLNQKEIELIEAYHLNNISEEEKIMLTNRLVNEPEFRTAFEEFTSLLSAMDAQRRLQTRKFLKSIDQKKNTKIDGPTKNKLLWMILGIIICGLIFVIVRSKKQVKNDIKELKTDVNSTKENDTTLIKKDSQTFQNKTYPLAEANQATRLKISSKYYQTPEFGTVRSSEKDSVKTKLIRLYYEKKYSEITKIYQNTKTADPEIKLLIGTAYYHQAKWRNATSIFTEIQKDGGLHDEAEWYSLLCYLNDTDQANKFKSLARKIRSNPDHSFYNETLSLLSDIKNKKITLYIPD